jgi:hypothetical protein
LAGLWELPSVELPMAQPGSGSGSDKAGHRGGKRPLVSGRVTGRKRPSSGGHQDGGICSDGSSSDSDEEDGHREGVGSGSGGREAAAALAGGRGHNALPAAVPVTYAQRRRQLDDLLGGLMAASGLDVHDLAPGPGSGGGGAATAPRLKEVNCVRVGDARSCGAEKEAQQHQCCWRGRRPVAVDADSGCCGSTA